MLSKPFSFDEARSWRGLWRAVDGRDIPGLLSYDPEVGLTLELFALLKDPMQTIPGSPGVSFKVGDDGHHDVLHGQVEGRAVTLIDCLSLGSRREMLASAWSGSEDLSVGTALFGAELHVSDRTFDRAIVALEGLTAWSGRSALTVSQDPKWSVGVEFPEVDQTATLRGVSYRLQHTIFGFSPGFRGEGTSVAVRDEVHLIIETEEPVSLGELREHAAKVVDLVSLARRARPRTLAFSPRCVDSDGATHNVKALWQERPSKTRKREEVAFTAADLGFSNVMATWDARREELISTVNLLRATWDDGWYLESSVLALATAVEALASTFDLPLKLSKAEYKAMYEQIVAGAPEERRAWLRQVLGPLNGPSLRERIVAVADRLPSAVRERLVPIDGTWADSLARVRNDLSHRGATTVDHEVLATLRQVTSAVLYLVLLKELGLPDEQVLRTMERDGYLSYACTRSLRDLGRSTTL